MVPKDLKNSMWHELKEMFQFLEGSKLLVKKDTISIMDVSIKNWKTKINKKSS